MNRIGQKSRVPTHASTADLIFPFEAPTASQRMIEVASGVRWLRMPLPYALDHINLWLLDDGEGATLIDTGVNTEEAIQVWRDIFDNGESPLTRVLVTHMHPDHIGLAGWLTRRFGIELWMSRLEYLTCRVMLSDGGCEVPPDAFTFHHQAGWNWREIENHRVRLGEFGSQIHPLPSSYHSLRDGDVLRVGLHDWQVITGSGHSPEHVCLYCPTLGLLISGDQVLPSISSNVSVLALEPDANPMESWLASLERLKRMVPDNVLVLPAHGLCFRGLHARIDALIAGQQRAFGRLTKALTVPLRAVDTFAFLFSRKIDDSIPMLLEMATGESIACLNYLINIGAAGREIDGNGVAWYRAKNSNNL
ncbi:MBL fold metallo-hydrolase [Burkholderia contaminans]|uniref:MBL fold metallo-hydrolase n=1 Tax=Burkholderia cepacia complex TaxID=87882 RepID=UPI0009BD4247|nr:MULTISPECIES: MBL fold metallo-hydrolase [Burkholderia cepacia complex]MDN7576833.1 MBL fold metallo-hydrolase [Burkholderia contaminans]PRF30710.1 MBL fold metallo-hydrolase [Burkholderia multivorans]